MIGEAGEGCNRVGAVTSFDTRRTNNCDSNEKKMSIYAKVKRLRGENAYQYCWKISSKLQYQNEESPR